MTSFSSVTLSLSILLAGYLSSICAKPPNPPTTTQQAPARAPYKTDRIRIITGSVAIAASHAVLIISIYHAIITLVHSQNTSTRILSTICPHPENVNRQLLTWSPTVLLSLLSIATGSAIRLAAFGRLGRNFTFYLSAPDQLVTGGVYAYVQHPSYTGLVLVGLGCVGLWSRWDGAVACLLSEGVSERVDGLGMAVIGVLGMVAVMVLGVRVRDEERMLRERFGGVWEGWHSRTARFVPGVL
jgi:protein-S-isoprenylcysteine O-methyltransferase Ste14